MIGVLVNPAHHAVVREFFELFKTPWELCRSHRQYDVLLCAGEEDARGATGKLVLVYSGQPLLSDAEASIRIASGRASTMLSYRGQPLPVYGTALTFRGVSVSPLTEAASGQPAACLVQHDGHVVVRLGYDLFEEIRALLTLGQPSTHAAIPTLDRHIALLRDLIVAYAGPLVEIPPVPDGYRLIACLTHDVDHPSIGRHWWDHTMFGFLYRAVIGSVLNVFRERMSMRDLLTNWAAAARLPFVYLGLAKDFWLGFDRYLEIERGRGATFFVIPVKDDPGRTPHGTAPAMRAARYGATDIADHLRRLRAAGCEIGVHGIDAWLDPARGSQELQRVSAIAGMTEVGVRMHWLYLDETSAGMLEKAGFAYDSTVGYNDTIGYRAGTTQVFKPLDAIRLLELPLHVMDTALFYPAHLDLHPREAMARVAGIIDNALHFGGTVTVNWHDRSIAPERLWGGFYAQVIDALDGADAWFATAQAAVAWFRKRRSVVFDDVGHETAPRHVRASVEDGDRLPDLRLRIHRARAAHPFSVVGVHPSDAYIDIPFTGGLSAGHAL